MKKNLLLILFSIIYLNPSLAQNKKILLFEKFTNAKVKLRPNGESTYPMNYDASEGKMYFMQGKDVMELTSTQNIDTISWGSRKFIPFSKRFLEVYNSPNGKIYIDWVIKDLVIGKKGAYGLQTQGGVQNLRIYDFAEDAGTSIFTPFKTQSSYSNDILQRRNKNVYYIDINGQRKKIKTAKQLENLYPNHKTQIHNYKKERSINFSNFMQAIELIVYSMGL